MVGNSNVDLTSKLSYFQKRQRNRPTTAQLPACHSLTASEKGPSDTGAISDVVRPRDLRGLFFLKNNRSAVLPSSACRHCDLGVILRTQCKGDSDALALRVNKVDLNKRTRWI